MNARRRRSSAAAASQRAPPTELASLPRAARHGCTETPPGTRSEGAARRRSGPPPRPGLRLRRGQRRQATGRPARREAERGARSCAEARRRWRREDVLSGCQGEGKETTRLTTAPSLAHVFFAELYVQFFFLTLLAGLCVFSPSPAGFWLFTAVPNERAPRFPCQPTAPQLSPVSSRRHCLPSMLPEAHPRRKGQL